MLKASKLLSIKGLGQLLCDHLIEFIYLENICYYHQLSDMFNVENLRDITVKYVERAFQQVIQTKSFLETDFIYLYKMLNNSKLDVTSELVTFDAVNLWVDHNVETRRTFAMQLLSKVRLHLLPVVTLKQLKMKNNCLSKLENFDSIIEKAIEHKKVISSEWNSSTGNRFCNQDEYAILRIGGIVNRDISSEALLLHGENFQCKSKLPPLISGVNGCHAINLNGTIYVLGGFSRDFEVNLVQKFTPGISESWDVAGEIPDYIHGFSVCSFLNKIYIFGGKYHEDEQGYCLCFDPVTGESNDLPSMIRDRLFATCTAFGDKVFVFGGRELYQSEYRRIRSVEVYDPDKNEWKLKNDMIECRSHLKSVVMKNKIVIFGSRFNSKGIVGDNSFGAELYDVFSNTFTLLKSVKLIHKKDNVFKGYMACSVCIGNKIVVFGQVNGEKVIYDVESNSWSKDCLETKQGSCRYSTFIKFPLL